MARVLNLIWRGFWICEVNIFHKHQLWSHSSVTLVVLNVLSYFGWRRAGSRTPDCLEQLRLCARRQRRFQSRWRSILSRFNWGQLLAQQCSWLSALEAAWGRSDAISSRVVEKVKQVGVTKKRASNVKVALLTLTLKAESRTDWYVTSFDDVTAHITNSLLNEIQ